MIRCDQRLPELFPSQHPADCSTGYRHHNSGYERINQRNSEVTDIHGAIHAQVEGKAENKPDDQACRKATTKRSDVGPLAEDVHQEVRLKYITHDKRPPHHVRFSAHHIGGRAGIGSIEIHKQEAIEQPAQQKEHNKPDQGCQNTFFCVHTIKGLGLREGS